MLRRNYISAADLTAITGATATHAALAELLIDQYVGRQNQFIRRDVVGKVSSIDTGAKIIVDTNSETPLSVTDNTYDRCVIEIIGGAGVGQSRVLVDSDEGDRSVTFEGEDFDPALDATSVYRIYQLAKFPRLKDVKTHDSVYYKVIPQAVREATIAQIEFILEMGTDYFIGEDAEFDSERILSYMYSRGGGQNQASALVKFLSPKTRVALRGFKNSLGELIPENPTGL